MRDAITDEVYYTWSDYAKIVIGIILFIIVAFVIITVVLSMAAS